MTFTTPYDAFRPTIDHNGGTDVSPDDLAVIHQLLDAAQEWQEGRLPLAAFAREGTLKPRAWSDDKRGIVCRGNDHGGYSRFKARCWAQKNRDPRLPALVAAIDALGRVGI